MTYKTPDFALASALIHYGHRILYTEKSKENPDKFVFNFLKTDAIENQVSLFYEKRLMVEVGGFMEALRYVKRACPELLKKEE